jgi:deazaflavin-dependent oxidoreductase (nitroreductase family)
MVAIAETPARSSILQHGVDGEPALPPPPEPTAVSGAASALGYAAFKFLNPKTTIPLLRAGLGPWMGTPFGGWMLLLRVRGRKSGLVREIPLSYLVDEGSVWVMAGFGPSTQWYRNLLADPGVEVILPGRSHLCVAREELDPAVRRRIIPQLVRATGLPGYMTGCDPYRAPVERMLDATAWVPLIRLTPVGEPLVAGPDDPGGHGWVWRQAVALVLVAWLGRGLTRLGRRVAGRLARR